MEYRRSATHERHNRRLRFIAQGLVMVLVALHHSLPAQAERLRRSRAPDEPESYFLFRLGFADSGSWHRLEFWVDDATAPERLFIEKLVHEILPLP
ncbi:MAG TPA: hypothetical protein DDY78_05760 [Planctomycetales bacterium]|jgi:hypothetical protein|nr:hypothetical protein [Planctomycetales bacterium]